MPRLHLRKILILPVFTFFLTDVTASTLQGLLEQKEAPEGVVIEIVESRESALEEVLPKVSEAVTMLRGRFPGLPIAVVSHGREQFALTRANSNQFSQTHNKVKSLVSDNVDFHVCGTHASWFRVSPEDFPEYVDVSPAGPAQINDYLSVGYRHLQIDAD